MKASGAVVNRFDKTIEWLSDGCWAEEDAGVLIETLCLVGQTLEAIEAKMPGQEERIATALAAGDLAASGNNSNVADDWAVGEARKIIAALKVKEETT